MTVGAMMFECRACGKQYRWKPGLAGKRVRCKCGDPIVVPPAPPGAAETPAPSDSQTQTPVAPDQWRVAEAPGDLPAFKQISTTFQIEKQKYFGMGVASPAALYLIMAQVRNDVAAGLAGSFGLVGGLIAGAIAAKGAKKNQPVATCTVGELSPQIRNHPDWPFKNNRKETKKQVFIIGKDGIDLIEHPRMTNLLKFNVGDTTIKIEYLLMRGKRIREYLAATGWPLNWAGQMINT